MRLVGALVLLAAFVLVMYVVWRVYRRARGDFPGPAGRGGTLGRGAFPRLRGFPSRGAEPILTVCLQCRGTGWISRRERTLEFTGDGFADVENPSTMCEACGGTGQRTR